MFYRKIVKITFQLHVTFICLPTYKRDLPNGKLNAYNLSSLESKTWGRRDLCFLRRRLYTKKEGLIVGLFTACGPSSVSEPFREYFATWLVQGNAMP